MRFAADYLFKDATCDGADEFNIEYNHSKNDYGKLISFVASYPDKRINVECFDSQDIEMLKNLSKLSDSRIYVRLTKSTAHLVPCVRSAGLSFFFDFDYSASTLCMLDSLISAGVSDVYIADDLWYSLKQTSDACHAAGVAVRAVLNRIPMTVPGCGSDVRSIIIRPEDVPSIDGMVDTAEFFIEDSMDDRKALAILKKAYLTDNKWYGDLREINKDLVIAFDCPTITPKMLQWKIGCGRRCSTGNGCLACQDSYDLCAVLRKKIQKLKK